MPTPTAILAAQLALSAQAAPANDRYESLMHDADKARLGGDPGAAVYLRTLAGPSPLECASMDADDALFAAYEADPLNPEVRAKVAALCDDYGIETPWEEARRS